MPYYKLNGILPDKGGISFNTSSAKKAINMLIQCNSGQIAVVDYKKGYTSYIFKDPNITKKYFENRHEQSECSQSA